MCVCVCVCVCARARVRETNVKMGVCVYACLSVLLCVPVYMCICIHARLCVRVCVSACLCVVMRACACCAFLSIYFHAGLKHQLLVTHTTRRDGTGQTKADGEKKYRKKAVESRVCIQEITPNVKSPFPLF